MKALGHARSIALSLASIFFAHAALGAGTWKSGTIAELGVTGIDGAFYIVYANDEYGNNILDACKDKRVYFDPTNSKTNNSYSFGSRRVNKSFVMAINAFAFGNAFEVTVDTADGLGGTERCYATGYYGARTNT